MTTEVPLPESQAYRTVNFHVWAPGGVLDRHAHTFIQVIHVREGVLHVEGGEPNGAVAAGCLYLCPAGHPHRLTSPDGHRQFGVNFVDTKTDRTGWVKALSDRCPSPRILPLPGQERLIEYLEALSHSYDQLSRLRLIHGVNTYVLDLLEALAPQAAGSLSGRLLEWLRARAHCAVSVDEACEALGCARSTLQASCRAQYGCGVAHLHERVRLDHAARMLLGQPNLSVAQCAELVGYPDQFSFSRRFKRMFGDPPSVWRGKRGQLSEHMSQNEAPGTEDNVAVAINR